MTKTFLCHAQNVWPNDFIYTNNLLQTCSIKKQLKENVVVPDEISFTEPRFLLNKNHPAYDEGRGIGLFAVKNIDAGTLVGSYSGEIKKLYLEL